LTFGYDKTFSEFFAESGRQDNAALLIEFGLMGAKKHRLTPPFLPYYTLKSPDLS
jgi:hypothetical protein